MARAGLAAPPAGVGFARAYVAEAAEAAAEAARRVGAVNEVLELAGGRIRLTFAGPALIEALFAPLAHLASAEAGPVDVTFALWDSASTGVPLPPVPWGPDSLELQGHVTELEAEGVTGYHNTHFGGITLYDHASSTGVYWVRDAATVPWYERGAPLRTAFHLFLPGPGRALVHAGAVGHAAGGVLLGGRSGSGKSTTALACVEAGLGYAGDDYVLLELEPAPVAHALYTNAKLDPGGLDRLPGVAGCVDERATTDEKTHLDVNRGRPGQVLRSLPVKAVVLPRVRGTGPTELRPMGPAAALRDLAPSTIVQMPREGGAALATITGLLRAVPAYRLDLGADTRDAVPLLGRLLEGS